MARAESVAEECLRVVDGGGRADEASVEEHEVLLAAKACGDVHPTGWLHGIAVIATAYLELRVAGFITSGASVALAVLAVGGTAGRRKHVGTCGQPLVHQGDVAVATGQVGDEHPPLVSV